MSNTVTVKTPIASEGGHWYLTNGSPCYEVQKADGKGMRAATLRDAKKLNLLPGVTTILKLLHKEALVVWRINQAVTAVVTAPDVAGEAIDAKIQRVLTAERQQDEEAAKAAELGSDIHTALEKALAGIEPCPEPLKPYVDPVVAAILARGKVLATEKVVVGEGYAGKTDLMLKLSETELEMMDFKTTKKLPEKESWSEHKLQLSAYAAPVQRQEGVTIRTANCYISTTEPGKFVIFENGNWWNDYENGFLPLVKHWQWSVNYRPQQ